MDKIGVIGLGYVGLPLATLFASKYEVVAFDINKERVAMLNKGIDVTGQVSPEKMNAALQGGMVCTSDVALLKTCNFFIVAVPTPTTPDNRPDVRFLEAASRTVGSVLKKGDTVVYESTVCPGITEDVCLPIVENESGLKLNVDFFAGYSPERINPCDSKHTVANVKKIVSGSTPEAAKHIDAVYNSVLENGTFVASSIRVAEAAKAMENAQRDVNIAFMNEMAMLLRGMGIDDREVIAAASTKWNFLPFEPGLVGGHCISVDPYYLIYEAREKGLNSRLLETARKVNESVGEYVADRTMKLLRNNGVSPQGAKVLVLGFSFKENCSDIRNTKVRNVVATLRQYEAIVTIFDPVVNAEEAQLKSGEHIEQDINNIKGKKFDAIVMTVKHREFDDLDLRSLLSDNGVVYDVKNSIKDKGLVTETL